DDIQPTLDIIEHRLKKGEAVPHFENRYRTKGGDYRWLNWTGHPNSDTSFFYALARDVTESKQAESLLAGEKQILEIIATSNSQDGGLTELLEFIESQSGGMICSILLLDDDGIHLRCGASGNLPEEYCQAIDGIEIGPAVGSCGTAAFSDKTVVVSDIATDPLWDNFRDLALKHNLRACWSIPIHASSGCVLGTFAMYYDQPRSPDAFHENLIERAIHLASIAIGKKQAEEELRQSELRSRTCSKVRRSATKSSILIPSCST
ncbi:MAG: GAF domain-containing protein, partial [Planctomycetes bacterium]|nr:GAF domain-containing protein [Planctomycetota bacterium]